MAARITWTRMALDRLVELASFVADRDADAGRRLARELYERAGALASHPMLGAPWAPGSGRGVRRIAVGSYLIYYVVRGTGPTPEAVVILTVRHGREREPVPDDLA